MKKITLVMILLFTTMVSAQFSEDFNGAGAAFPPAGWAVYDGANALGLVEQWEQTGTDPNFSAQCIWEAVTAGSVAEDWLVTPSIAIDATNNLLSFDATDYNAGDFGSVLSIRVSSTSQTDTTSFNEILSLDEAALGNNPNSAVTFTTYEADLTAYVGQSIFIAFVHVQNDGDAVAVDNVVLSPAPSCSEPSNLSFDDFTTTTADISWDNTGTFTVEWGEFPHTQGDFLNIIGTTVVNGTSYQIDNLTPGVSYNVFVRQDCGVDGVSASVEVLVGTVPDSAINFPFNEDFEIDANQALFLNLGVFLNNDTGAFEFGRDDNTDGDTTNDFAFNGTDFFSSNSTFTDADSDATIFLGPYSLDSGFEYTFSVQQRNLVVSTATVPSKDIELVAATTRDGTTNTVLATFDNMDNITYTLRAGNFIPPSSGEYYFGVRDKTALLPGVTAGNRVFIDDVNISSVPLSIESVNEVDLKYYFNSNDNILNIEAPVQINKVAIYNTLGAVVTSYDVNDLSAQLSTQLSSGMYIVKADLNGSSQSFKIIKK